jgi:recombinational DNA repair ATPase RecF
MYISGLEINNYKSFRQSGLIPLTEGFNVIVGQNNAGKTTLLEALSLNFIDKPHRNLRTAPSTRTTVNQDSTVKLSLSLEKQEVHELLANRMYGLGLPITEARVSYDKVTHGVLLTEWIIENAPQDFKELVSLLNVLIPAAKN